MIKSQNELSVKPVDTKPPVVIDDMLEADAGLGQEGIGREDLMVPRILIVQALSPIMSKKDPAYNPEAEVGDIHEVSSGRLYDGEAGIEVLPIQYRKAHIEWRPRKQGGGFVHDHGADATILDKCTRDDRGRYFTSEGNNIVPTAEYLVFLVDRENASFEPVLIGMASTQLKKSRKWNTAISRLRMQGKNGSFNPPMFARTYVMTTALESNNDGEWSGWNIAPGELVSQIGEFGMAMYNEARALRESYMKGDLKISDPASNHSDYADPNEAF